MTEILVAPDVEAAAVVFFRDGLGVLADHVATKVPDPLPARMVRVSLTGGSRRDVATETAQVTVECWGPDAPSASEMARTAYALALSAAGSADGPVWVRRVETVGGVQFFPDPDTNNPRYQFTVRWSVRPSAI